MSSNQFHCDLCKFNCKDKRTFYSHLKKPYHINLVTLHNAANLQNQSVLTSPQEVQEDITYKCIFCDASYRHRSSLSRHTATCKKQSVLKSLPDLDTMSNTDALKLIDKLKINKGNPATDSSSASSQEEGSPNKGNAQHNIITNNITQNNNTIINNINQTNNIFVLTPFGKEDLSMLTDDIKKHIITRGTNAFGILLDEIYKHPQNNNIYLYDKRNGLVKYVDTNKNIKITKLKHAISELVDINFDRLDDYMDDYYDEIEDKLVKYVDKLKKAHTDKDDKKVYKDKYLEVSLCKLNEISLVCKQTFKTIAGSDSPNPVPIYATLN